MNSRVSRFCLNLSPLFKEKTCVSGTEKVQAKKEQVRKGIRYTRLLHINLLLV